MVHRNSIAAHRSIKSTGTDKLHRDIIIKALKTLGYFPEPDNERGPMYKYAGTAIGISTRCTLDRYQVHRRMSELMADGYVIELPIKHYTTRSDGHRQPNSVYQLTQKGVDCLEGGKL